VLLAVVCGGCDVYAGPVPLDAHLYRELSLKKDRANTGISDFMPLARNGHLDNTLAVLWWSSDVCHEKLSKRFQRPD